MSSLTPTNPKTEAEVCIKELHHKKIMGSHITNTELLVGIKYFDDLAKMLHKGGPVFYLAFKEANDTYNVLYNYAVARNLTIPK